MKNVLSALVLSSLFSVAAIANEHETAAPAAAAEVKIETTSDLPTISSLCFRSLCRETKLTIQRRLHPIFSPKNPY